jgi:outer membrane immunogenic protein
MQLSDPRARTNAFLPKYRRSPLNYLLKNNDYYGILTAGVKSAKRSQEVIDTLLPNRDNGGPMKRLLALPIVIFALIAVVRFAFAGPEPLPSGKEMKEVAPAPPPECNWTGFYIGVNVGGQWGHSEDRDLDAYSTREEDNIWGYDESGVIAGGTIGYNYQWNWLVLGIEGDLGYMNVEGDGVSRFDARFLGSDTHGKTDSDFYTTIRGRLGFARGHWLFYATGGGIGVNLETRVIDNCDTGACGDELINAGTTNFNWGWTGGGGIEYMFGCHWTIKGEYLRYQLGDQSFSGEATFFGTPVGRFRFTGIGTEGNIFRAGLNFKF